MTGRKFNFFIPLFVAKRWECGLTPHMGTRKYCALAGALGEASYQVLRPGNEVTARSRRQRIISEV